MVNTPVARSGPSIVGPWVLRFEPQGTPLPAQQGEARSSQLDANRVSFGVPNAEIRSLWLMSSCNGSLPHVDFMTIPDTKQAMNRNVAFGTVNTTQPVYGLKHENPSLRGYSPLPLCPLLDKPHKGHPQRAALNARFTRNSSKQRNWPESPAPNARAQQPMAS